MNVRQLLQMLLFAPNIEIVITRQPEPRVPHPCRVLLALVAPESHEMQALRFLEALQRPWHPGLNIGVRSDQGQNPHPVAQNATRVGHPISSDLFASPTATTALLSFEPVIRSTQHIIGILIADVAVVFEHGQPFHGFRPVNDLVRLNAVRVGADGGLSSQPKGLSPTFNLRVTSRARQKPLIGANELHKPHEENFHEDP